MNILSYVVSKQKAVDLNFALLIHIIIPAFMSPYNFLSIHMKPSVLKSTFRLC